MSPFLSRMEGADELLRGLATPIAAIVSGVTTLGLTITTDNTVAIVSIPAALLSVYGAFALYRRAGQTLREENTAVSVLLANERKANIQKDEELERLRAEVFALRLFIARQGLSPEEK
jgi:hypothetical protein